MTETASKQAVGRFIHVILVVEIVFLAHQFNSRSAKLSTIIGWSLLTAVSLSLKFVDHLLRVLACVRSVEFRPTAASRSVRIFGRKVLVVIFEFVVLIKIGQNRFQILVLSCDLDQAPRC